MAVVAGAEVVPFVAELTAAAANGCPVDAPKVGAAGADVAAVVVVAFVGLSVAALVASFFSTAAFPNKAGLAPPAPLGFPNKLGAVLDSAGLGVDVPPILPKRLDVDAAVVGADGFPNRLGFSVVVVLDAWFCALPRFPNRLFVVDAGGACPRLKADGFGCSELGVVLSFRALVSTVCDCSPSLPNKPPPACDDG